MCSVYAFALMCTWRCQGGFHAASEMSACVHWDVLLEAWLPPRQSPVSLPVVRHHVKYINKPKDTVFIYMCSAPLPLPAGYFQLDAPATPERLRMLSGDDIAAAYADPATFRAKISC